MSDFSELLGKTILEIEGGVGSEVLIFRTEDGATYRQCHYQDCCETVCVNDIAGDFSDLIGTPILLAEEATYINEQAPDGAVPDSSESFTWTFYKLATAKGHVTIRWLGESNGYYSESVYFEEVTS